MALKISFDCRAYKEDKSPNLEFGVHLILSDGCMIDLKGIEGLSQAQKQSLETVKRDDRKKHFLLYQNTKLLDRLFDPQGVLKVFCPTCENEYILTRQDYQEAYERFGRGM
jgi:hypothetical protein